MQYNGDLDDTCVISFLPVTELERPVGFDSRRAFECESVVHWLTQYRATHPITGQRLCREAQPVASVLHPLIINGRSDHVASTTKILERAGKTIHLEPVVGTTAKLASDALIGLVGLLLSCGFWRDLAAIVVVALMFCSHYPRNGGLIALVVAVAFVINWQILKLYGVVVADRFMELHLFADLFYVAKLVLDLVAH